MRIENLINERWIFCKGDISVKRSKDKGAVYSQSKTERKLMGPASYRHYDIPNSYYTAEHELEENNWVWVDLPHDYIIEQVPDKNENNAGGYFKYENAWYRKHFKLPEGSEGKRVTIRFDGIAGKSTIYLNGCLMYHNYSAYNTFEVDISDNVYYDKDNIIAIHINTDEWEGWWYQGAGIYRDVHLTITEPVAIDLWGVYCPYKKIGENDWQIDFETTVVNSAYQDADIECESFVLDDSGKCLVQSKTNFKIEKRKKTTLRYSTVVSNPLLWDCDNPNLYTVKTILKSNDEVIDENITRIGFRTVEFTSDGLFLNGKKTFINGVCGHQDFGITGLAVADNVAKYKIKLIKEMGANGYRTSHYQQTAAYLDACDEMGLLVMDELRWFESTEEGIKQLDSLVLRDRNRPSVIMWSTGNEEYYFTDSVGQRIHRALYERILSLDRTRVITAAQDRLPEESQIYEFCDVVGINYNLGIYEKVHEKYPDKAIVASECGAVSASRDWIYPDGIGKVSDIDADGNSWFVSRETTWKSLKSLPFVVGAYQWVAFDHRGEAVWPAISSKCGSYDMFLYKKNTFYQNKAYFTEEPIVHLATHWNFIGLEGRKMPVIAYTNCDELELFLNGKSQGKKYIEKYGHGEWLVPYEGGKLEIKGYKDGVLVCEDQRTTTGAPKTIRLTLDNEVIANGRDVALFTCECLDSNGCVVPDAAEYVKFTSNAKILGTGSDNCDHASVIENSRQMYMGKIRVAVLPKCGQERIELIAESVTCGKTFLEVLLEK